MTSLILERSYSSLVGDLQEEADVLDGGDLERRQDDDLVGRVHHAQRVIGQGGGQVDHDPVRAWP